MCVCSVLSRSFDFLKAAPSLVESLPADLMSSLIDVLIGEATTESRFGVVRADALQVLLLIASVDPAYTSSYATRVRDACTPLRKCADGRIAERAIRLCAKP